MAQGRLLESNLQWWQGNRGEFVAVHGPPATTRAAEESYSGVRDLSLEARIYTSTA